MENPVPLKLHPKKKWYLLAAVASLLDIDTKESRDIVLEYKRIPLHGLPKSFDGFKIIHLSDLHVREFSKKEEKLLSILHSLSADIAVITGDFSFMYEKNEESTVGYIKEVCATLKSTCKVLGVRGNSDTLDLMDKLKRIGIDILANECIEIRRGDEVVFIGGVDDPHHRMDDVQRTFSGIIDSGFKILLAHSPDVLLRMNDIKIDLLLTGHTHGGHVNLPVIGPVITKTRIGRKFASGLRYYRGTCIHISRGIGGISLRYRCSPEVSLLELIRS